MRLGYFGGTFDPPHRGHLNVALAAADAFSLDKVLLAPTGVQPLRDFAANAGYEDRAAMTRLLCVEDPRLEMTGIDAPHEDGSPNYTVDVLAKLRETQPDDEIFVLSGADSFLSLRRWRQPEMLLRMAEWIVISRPEFDLGDLAGLALTEDERAKVHLLESVEDETSASGIRERLRVGVSCGQMLTPAVSLYIARMHLYHAR